MRKSACPFVVLAFLSVVSIGCYRSNDQETARLRADLEKANLEITQLKDEITRMSRGDGQKDAGKQQAKAKARLLVVRGLRPNWAYPVYEGRNILGRADKEPVDIDLQPQEPEDRIWSSRQHAAITCKSGAMVIEDLMSTNGTYVNSKRVQPGEKCPLKKDDVIQIGAVQIKVLE